MSRKKYGSTAQGRSSQGSARPEVYVSVYCAGTADAPHDKWRIGSLFPEIYDGAIVWHAFNGFYYEPASSHGVPISGRVSQWLEGNSWVSHRKGSHDRDVFNKDDFRVRWNFACETCKMRQPIARPADYYESFTAVAQLGVFEIELLHLIHADTPTP